MAEGDTVYTQEQLDAKIAEANAALEAKRDEILKETKALRAKLKGFDGVDPEEFKALKEAAEEAERKRALGEGDFKKLEEQLVARHRDELAKKEVREKKLQAALEKRLVQAELTAAIARQKGDAELLLPHASKYVRVKETDDDFHAYVSDEKGDPLYADGQGTPMTFDQLVEQKLIPRFPSAFEGTGSSGGGASKSAASGGGSGRAIAAGDGAAFLANVEDIAAGKAVVR